MGDSDNRWEPRKPVRTAAQLRSVMHPSHEVTVTDICGNGLRLETWARHHVGDNVWLRLPTLSAVPARVIWSEAHVTGCKFERPLHPAVLTMLVDRHGE